MWLYVHVIKKSYIVIVENIFLNQKFEVNTNWCIAFDLLKESEKLIVVYMDRSSIFFH